MTMPSKSSKRIKSSKTTTSSKTKKIQVNPESRRSVAQFEDDHAFEEFEFQADRVWELGLIFTYYKARPQADQVRKLGLIFTYCKSKVSGRSGQEIGTDVHLLQVRGCRPIRSGNWDWSSPITNPRSQANQVRKLGLIFIYYKSEVSGQSGQKIGTDLHLLQVRGRRLIRSGNWDWSSPTTSPRSQGDQVWKLGMIFIYYKSEVAGRSSQEIGTDLHPTKSPRSRADRVWKFRQDQFPEETVRISQLYKAKS